MECSGVLPTTKFVYQTGLGTCDAFLENAQQVRNMQISIREAIDRVNFLNKLCAFGI